MKTARLVRLALVAVLPGLLALACHSGSGSRDAALDTALAADVPNPSDTRALDGPPSEDTSGIADTRLPFDDRPDAPIGVDLGVDLAEASEDGPDASTTFQCNFSPVTIPNPLLCERGQYCLAFAGGPVGSGITFSCAPPPTACAGNLTCECLCGKGGPSNCSVPASPSIHCTCLSDRMGPVFLCAAP